jgi:hypothetical protein
MATFVDDDYMSLCNPFLNYISLVESILELHLNCGCNPFLNYISIVYPNLELHPSCGSNPHAHAGKPRTSMISRWTAFYIAIHARKPVKRRRHD